MARGGERRRRRRAGGLDALLAAARARPGRRRGRPAAACCRTARPSTPPCRSPASRFTAAFALGLTRRSAERLCSRARWDPDRARRVPWAVGAFLLVRRDGVGRRRRLRRAPVAVRRGPRPRLAPAPGRLGDALRAARRRPARTGPRRPARRSATRAPNAGSGRPTPGSCGGAGRSSLRAVAALNVLGAMLRAAVTRDQSQRRVFLRLGTAPRDDRTDDRTARPAASALSIPG